MLTQFVESLQLRFALFQTINFRCLTVKRITAPAEKILDVLRRAAQDRIKTEYSWKIEADVDVWNVRGTFWEGQSTPNILSSPSVRLSLFPLALYVTIESPKPSGSGTFYSRKVLRSTVSLDPAKWRYPLGVSSKSWHKLLRKRRRD